MLDSLLQGLAPASQCAEDLWQTAFIRPGLRNEHWFADGLSRGHPRPPPNGLSCQRTCCVPQHHNYKPTLFGTPAASDLQPYNTLGDAWTWTLKVTRVGEGCSPSNQHLLHAVKALTCAVAAEPTMNKPDGVPPNVHPAPLDTVVTVVPNCDRGLQHMWLYAPPPFER